MPLEVWDARTDIRNLLITPQVRSRIMRFDVGEVSGSHTHDVGHEMFVVLDGRAEFTVDGESAVLDAGQACVALAGQPHQVRTVGDRPMTLYLSVTPHVEPTHTFWEHAGGARLPYRYGNATSAERMARAEPVAAPAELLRRHVHEAQTLAQAAQANASAQASAASQVEAALAVNDPVAARAAIDAMWAAFYALHRQLQASQEAWNELAPAVAGGD